MRSNKSQVLVAGISALVVLVAVTYSLRQIPPTISDGATPPNVASVAATLPTLPASSSTMGTTGVASKSTTTSTIPKPSAPPTKLENIPPQQAAGVAVTANTSIASRIESPYVFDPLPFEIIDARARAATVNILCMPKGGSLRPTSGSGVIIDPRGIILTDAHVAQYILLSQDPRIDLSCVIRSGSPAVAHWIGRVMYIPSSWVDAHYGDLKADRPTGTGEHDYALVQIVADFSGNSPKAPFPYLPIDSRPNIAFQDDHVLVAGYPAEFAGGLIAQRDLYAVTALSTIGKLFTFKNGTVDLFSIGGIIAAQGGSSGGPVVNQWGDVVGIITTTSDGTTTSARDLHANALSYIENGIAAETGKSLSQILSGDIFQTTQEFSDNQAPALIEKYLGILTN